jgi:hypothetical protein
LFCWDRWNCWSSLCNLSFHNVIFVHPTIFPLQYAINTHSSSLPFINCTISGNYSKWENIQNINSVIFQQWEVYTLHVALIWINIYHWIAILPLAFVCASYSINKVCDSINKVLNVRCFNRQYICPVGWTGVSTNDWYSNGYELCAPLLTNLFLHAYEVCFLQGLLKNKNGKLAHTFNSSFRYIDDVLSLNKSRFGDCLHHIYRNKR